jgi:hypothetical protein
MPFSSLNFAQSITMFGGAWVVSVIDFESLFFLTAVGSYPTRVWIPSCFEAFSYLWNIGGSTPAEVCLRKVRTWPSQQNKHGDHWTKKTKLNIFIPPHNKVVRGVYWNQLVCPSGRPSGCQSVFSCPSNNFRFPWPLVFIFGMEVSHD